MTDKISSMAEFSGKGTLQSPEGCLRDALEMIGKDGAFEKGKKLIIIALDDTDGGYSISWSQAGMKMSECVTLCEAAKSVFMDHMGY